MSREDDFYEGTALPSDMTFQREGLPAGYRMRHDEHYVDELVAAGTHASAQTRRRR